jgi:hypothetical protein
MKNKTALIIVYAGEMPNYIRLFLKGCEYNDDVDLLFFTDWDWSKLPIVQNVVNTPFSLRQFNEKATQKCGIEIQVQTGYKLCDLKPAWPHIFEDYVSDYEFVGYCDIDLIFGRINHFFTDDVKKRTDIFTITQPYISGALTIFRNNSKITKLYQKARGWKKIFQDPRHFAFDEYLRITDISTTGVGGKIQSFSDLVFTTKQITLHNDKYIGYEKRPKLTTFDHGIIYAENEEWIFFHYVVAKQTAFWTIPDWSDIPDKFHVNKYGFYRPKQRVVSFIDLLRHPYYRRQIMSSIKKKQGTIKRLINKRDIKLLFKAVLKQSK